MSELITPSEAINRLYDKIRNGHGPVFSGIKAIDDAMKGFRPGKLYFICSRPAVGKTTLALTIAKNIDCGDVFFSSAEMNAEELHHRILKLGKGCGEHIVRSCGNATIEDIICDLSNWTDVRAIFVDYLQLMADGAEEALTFVLALLRLAIDFNVPVFLTSQLLPSADCRLGGPCDLDLPFDEDVESLASGIIYLYDAGPYTDKGKPVNAFVTSKFTAPKTVELFFSTETFSFN